jgi:ABC-type Mn2+/Zn2+ transport system ATPase subunit
MQAYDLTLRSPVSKSFRCQRAANALDIDTEKKSIHRFHVDADLETPFDVGLIVGASGSGKTTLAKHIWGDECFRDMLDMSKPVIDQFPKDWNYDDCATALAGVGLTQVPCWIRPAHTLSNGQRSRAEIALQMARPENDGIIVIDEWTSVVDRTVAKVMSYCIAKHARRTEGRRIVLLSCHYDVTEWLQPDWIIDCNKQQYSDRRSVRRSREEQLQFDIREVGRDTWPYFSKYHYLSDKLPGGVIFTFGLFHGDEQVGFQCFANYVPHRKNSRSPMKLHSNRTVIHPDYVGFGMGMTLIDQTSAIMLGRGFDIWAKFTSTPVYKAMSRNDNWKLMDIQRAMKTVVGGNMLRKSGFREQVKTFSFRYVGPDEPSPEI